MVGLDSGEFNKMMKGQRKITDRTLHKVSDACGVNFDWLLAGDGEMMPPKDGTLIQLTGGGDALKDSVKIEGGSDRWFELMKKRDEQIDRLLTIIENMQKTK